MAARGRFITLEGGEAAGKSTQARLLAQRLERAGHRVVLTREPGGTTGAELVRTLLLSDQVSWSPLAETLLHFAARADHVAKRISPALLAGSWVVCDRFSDSTMAYQGFGQGADRAEIARLGAMLGIAPDLTLVLDVPLGVSLARLEERRERLDRYEQLGLPFFGRVRNGFATIAAEEPQRCAVIQGQGDKESVGEAIWREVAARLGVVS